MTQEKELEKNSKIEDQKPEEKSPKKQRKCYLHSSLMPILFWLVFAGLFYFFAYDLATIKYDDITNPELIKIFSQFAPFTGLVLGFLSMTLGYSLLLVLKLIKLNKYSIVYPISAWLMVMPWYFMARQFVYFENKYTDIARGVIYYIGEPLLSTTKFLSGLIFVWALIIIIKFIIKKGLGKRAALTASILVLPFLLTGCVGTINEWACGFFDNPDHCLQSAAIQDGNPDGCASIKGEDFVDSGSNPPRDKCYLKIAENTGDLSVCDKIAGGLYSYTKEECILDTSIKFKNPSGCAMLTGADKANCVSAVSPYITSGSVIDMDDQIAQLKEELKNNPDKDLQEQLNGLEKMKQDYLAVMNEANKKEYESLTDPLNKQAAVDYYAGRIDEKTKKSLIALNDSLREKGNSMTEKEYKAIRDVLAYKNDPKNDIENMDPTEIVKLRWNEKIGNAVDYLKFWNSNPTATEKKYDESLLFYERMLERQAAIDKGLNEAQQDFDRNAGMAKDYIKGQVYDKVMDEAKKQAFGELMDLVASDAEAPVTAVLGEAIDTVKKEAKSAEFRGLVRAYDLGMEEELAKVGGNVDKAHAIVVANLQKNPYMYEDKNTYAKYGNILENKDCDGSNPHCINRDVFWKAMKKSYTYQNK